MKEKFFLRELQGAIVEDRRIQNRKEISSPIKVRFSVEYEGELVDISPEGIGVKFHPLKSHSLDAGGKIPLQLDMHNKLISMIGEIRRISEKFGFITLGLQYDREELATISIKTSNELKSKE